LRTVPLLLLFFLPLFSFCFSSCGAAQVLGHPREEAAELLRKGDIGFILNAQPPAGSGQESFSRSESRLKELLLIHPGAPFYAGLLLGGESPELELLLFCAALESPSLTVRQEAGRKLIPHVLTAKEDLEARDILSFLDSKSMKGKEDEFVTALRAACLYRLGEYDETVKLFPADSVSQDNEWGRALSLFAAWRAYSAGTGVSEKLKNDLRVFLFALSPGEIRQWAYAEALSLEGLLVPEEQAILSIRLSSPSYKVMLNNLRPILHDGGLIFFRYPSLIADLGRAYQYTPGMREEGADLFKSWDRILEVPVTPPDENLEQIAFVKTLDSGELKVLKYSILHYLGRIERAGDHYAESTEHFKRALEFAPDPLQADACIWYMLMNALSKDPAGAAALVLDTMPAWNDVSYFEDILDRLSSYLTAKRQWAALLGIFSRLEDRASGGVSGASLAQYAWILGRAVQEGYLKTGHSAEDFFRIAFEEGNGSFYYRAMAASKLGETFAPERDNGTETPDSGKTREDEPEFIRGFFECGAASRALPYIQEREADLSIPALRSIAESLESSGRWKEALDLISRYTQREDYRISREDLSLFYPRPFREPIEKYAHEAGLGEEILYGLIRTESYFMPGIVSRSGAVGLSQLMAPTAADMAGRIARQGGPDYRVSGRVNLEDPEANIHIGSYYLRYLSEQTGSPMLALLSYNGGMGRVRRWQNLDRARGSLPHDLFLETIEYSETREYGRRVLAAAAVYGYLYYGMTMEEVAADIYR